MSEFIHVLIHSFEFRLEICNCIALHQSWLPRSFYLYMFPRFRCCNLFRSWFILKIWIRHWNGESAH